MQVTKNITKTTKGPSEWFTGDVYLDPIVTPSHGSRLNASVVHFTPGARTAWHTHPNGQTIYVTEGVGLAQQHGGPAEVIRPGDRVFFLPGENHWHGASPTRFMTHISMVEVDEKGDTATWGDKVTDDSPIPCLRQVLPHEWGRLRLVLPIYGEVARRAGGAALNLILCGAPSA